MALGGQRGKLMILDYRIPYFFERDFLAGNAVFSRRGKWAMKKENGTERWTDPCHEHAAHALPIFQRYYFPLSSILR